jgi:hypothetical protein
MTIIMNLLLTGFIIVSLLASTAAQITPGARQISLANSDAAQSDDVFSLFTNPAGLAQINWREVGVYYSPSPFGLSELANGYVAYVEPLGFGSAGIGGMTYGFDLYRESKIIGVFSYNYLNKFFIGAALNFHSVAIQSYGEHSTFYFNLGGLVYLAKELRWGFAANNINRASFGSDDGQIPMPLNTGVSYDPISNATINFGIEKDLEYNPSFKFGLEYEIIRYLALRSGVSTEPDRYTFGIGINYSLINFDYAFFTHKDLGLTHQAGIIISFGSDAPRREKIKQHLNN